MRTRLYNLLILSCLSGIAGCHKTDSFTGPFIEDYMPLHAGHSITYRLDSIVFTHFGTVWEQHSYIVKDSIENAITDAAGRPSWRMVRYYRDANDATVWRPAGVSMITALPAAIELVENNLRYVKLSMPVQDTRSWPGNSYLPFQPYGPVFDFSYSDHNQPSGWDYIYQDLHKADTINGLIFDNTITVACSTSDSSNFPPTDPTIRGYKTTWVEQYARGVGLVYKDVVLMEYHLPNIQVPHSYYLGFELKMSIMAYQ